MGSARPRVDPFDVRALDLKRDKYTVTVHVIECKDMQGEDGTRPVDAMIEIDMGGEKRTTRTHNQVSACSFDERHVFEEMIETDERARSTGITLSLFDVTGFGGLRRALIGKFSVPLAWLAAQPQHELHRRWFGFERTGESGIPAKLRASLSVTWGRGSLPSHADDELSDEELIVTPAVRRKSHLVIARIHRAVGLPKLDMFGSIDPYVELSHGRESVRTSIVNNNRSPLWEQQLELPYVVPATSSAVVVMLWDGDILGREPVGAVTIPYADIPQQTAFEREHSGDHEPPPGTTARWYYLYGAPPLLGGRAATKMNMGRTPGIAFRGRVLITIWACEDLLPVAQSFELPLGPPQQLQAKWSVDLLGNSRVQANTVARTISQSEARRNKLIAPVEEEYVLRVWLHSGSYLPAGALSVELEFGGVLMQWGTFVTLGGEIAFRKAKEERRRLPDDARQLPDVFVYLLLPLARTAGRPVRVAYARYSALDLLNSQDKPWQQPKWTQLTEVAGFGAFASQQDPGFLLLGVMLRRSRELSDLPFDEDLSPLYGVPVRFELVLRVYLAHNLPAADETGSLDPYLVLHCGSRKVKTEVRTQTSNPKWYQQYSLELALPRERTDLGPLVLLYLWDKDRVGGDERLAQAQFDLSKLPRHLGDEVIEDVPLFFRRPGDLPGTSVLCSLSLIELRGYEVSPPKEVELKGELCVIEVIVVSCRGLESRLMGSLNRPYCVFDLGLGGDYRQLKQTAPASLPNSANPTYVQVIRLQERLARDERFTPSLSIRLIDPTLGGLVGTQIGQTSLSLVGMLPWTEREHWARGRPVGLGAAAAWAQQLDAAIDAMQLLPGAETLSSVADGAGGAGASVDLGAIVFEVGAETSVHDLRMQAILAEPSLAKQVYSLQYKGTPLAFDDVTLDSAKLRTLVPESVPLGEIAAGVTISVVRALRLGEDPMHVSGLVHAQAAATSDEESDSPSASTSWFSFGARARAPQVESEGAFKRGGNGGGGGRARGFAHQMLSVSGGRGAADALEGGQAGAAAPRAALPRSVSFKPGTPARNSAAAARRGGGSGADADSSGDEIDFAPRYMDARRYVRTELEKDELAFPLALQTLDSLALRRGELGAKMVSVRGDSTALVTRECGVFKALVRVVEQGRYMQEGGLAQAQTVLEKLKVVQYPRRVVVRLYLLRILELLPQDMDGTADPYVIVTLGGQRQGDRSQHLPHGLQANVHTCFEFNASLPGDALLKIDVYDYSLLGTDDFIGSTTIDLEARWCSATWHRFARKPVERRALLNPKSALPQGQAELWVDILHESRIRAFPIVATRPPSSVDFELRVIIWETKYAPMGEGGKTDLFVKGILSSQGLSSQAQETDVHYFVRNGKGQFNWRFVFRIQLPARQPRLVLEMWEWDFLTGGYVLAKQTIPLRSLLRRAFRARDELIDQKASLYLDLGSQPGAFSKGWAHLDPTDEALRKDRKTLYRQRRRKFPKVLCTIEIVPLEVATLHRPAGIGRDVPNANPAMPDPKRPPSGDMVYLAFRALWAELNASVRINWVLFVLFLGFVVLVAAAISDNVASIRLFFVNVGKFFNGDYFARSPS